MKILVTGDRNWDDYDLIAEALSTLPAGTIIVHGDCRGADIICAEIAKSLGFIVRPYPADWERYGRAAGPIRNKQMITEEHLLNEPIDFVYAFHDDIKNSRGTKNMLKQAESFGIRFRLFSSPRRITG
jgi:hypothetical protein